MEHLDDSRRPFLEAVLESGELNVASHERGVTWREVVHDFATLIRRVGGGHRLLLSRMAAHAARAAPMTGHTSAATVTEVCTSKSAHT